MTTREMVLAWLDKHRGFTRTEVSDEDFAHFVCVLTDCAEYCIEERMTDVMRTRHENHDNL